MSGSLESRPLVAISSWTIPIDKKLRKVSPFPDSVLIPNKNLGVAREENTILLVDVVVCSLRNLQ